GEIRLDGTITRAWSPRRIASTVFPLFAYTYVFACVRFALGSSCGIFAAIAVSSPKVKADMPRSPRMVRRARSLSLRMRRRFGGRGVFLRRSAKNRGSLARYDRRLDGALQGAEAPPRAAPERVMGLSELTRNAVDVLPAGGLEAKLKLRRPLRVKLGIDVTSPDIHIGRAIPLQRMRAFQDEGHTGVLIIGD